MISSRPLASKTFAPEENHVRSLLYARQDERIHHSNAVHSMLVDGYNAAQLPADRCPDALEISANLLATTGRKLTDAKNPYLSDEDRYSPLHDKHFPATNYIRKLEELEFTPLPDLAHDYFGHMPLMFHPEIADLQRRFANMYKHANEEQQQDIYSLARYVIEYSVVKEQGKEKIFGAWLLSSPGDFQRFIDGQFKFVPADLETILTTDRSPDKPHTHLFVYESFDAMKQMVDEYEKRLEYNK